MAGNRTLKLSILADVDDLKKKLGQGEKEVKGFGDKLGEFGKKAAVAFTVAAAAAAAYAGKLLVDGVKAAIEDEKANAKLAATLKNVTGATDNQIDSVLAYTRATELATGVTEDELRPSLNRLAIATGDVKKATDLQKIALDVAAGSGKGLEAVSQALAKAYEGNTASLGRLGIGLSSAELSAMSFEDITKSLSSTFEGQADVAANTLQGRMDRLRLAFEDVRDTVGEKLLPIIEKVVNFFLNDAGPAVEGIRKKFEPLTKALKDNKDEFTAVWNFLNKYIVPILTGALKLAVSGMVTTFTTLVSIVGKAVTFFTNLYNAYKKFVDFIKNNPLSKFVDKINPFDNASFSNAGFLTAGGAGGVDELGRPVTGDTQAVDSATENKRRNTMWKSETIFRPTNECPSGQGVFLVEYNYYGEIIKQSLNYCVPFPAQNSFTGSSAGTGVVTATTGLAMTTGSNGNANTSSGITINVNAPSAIDTEGFTRSVIQALNESQSRTGSLDTLAI
jgi:hypothetical protein